MELIKDTKGFAEEFEKNALSRFGSLNKNDYEVLILTLLKKYGSLKGMSPFDISIKLRISESKVKKLLYDSNIVYGNYSEEEMIDTFFQLLTKSKFVADGREIKFAIEDKYLRTSIQALLKREGFFADGSFNSDVVVINYVALSFLLDLYYKKRSDYNDIKSNVEKAMKDSTRQPFSWSSLGQSFANGVVENIPNMVDLIKIIAEPTSAALTVAGSIVKLVTAVVKRNK